MSCRSAPPMTPHAGAEAALASWPTCMQCQLRMRAVTVISRSNALILIWHACCWFGAPFSFGANGRACGDQTHTTFAICTASLSRTP